METGIKGHGECAVTERNTAKAFESGALEVFATPAMAALMEKTACKSVAPYLGEGESTVGVSLNIRHISATPAGMKVRCESELIAVDGRKLVFKVKAYDETGLIGSGEHERSVITNDRFMARVLAKLRK